MIVKTEEQLLAEVNKTEKVLIYGSGNIARTMIRYFQKKEIVLEGIAVRKAAGESMFGFETKHLDNFTDLCENCTVVICATSGDYESAHKFVENRGFKNIIIVDYEFYVDLSVAENVHMDFLCAGFSKSGTTSLQTAFKTHPAIFLPKNKESYYLSWRKNYDDAPERFRKRYFDNIPEGKVVGNIEPSYHGRAKGAYECFGRDLKIILMMRNPIDATYSNFKMLMKNPKEKKQAMYFKKHNAFHVDMFDNYMEDYIFNNKDKRYQYSRYVEQFVEVFGRDQVKLVIFEELIKDPETVLNDLQDYIGVPRETYKKMPKSNAGKFVSKNYISALINCKLYQKKLAMKASSVKQMDRYWKVANFLHKHTYVENSEKMSQESRETLKEFYAESVKKLSEIAGRDLSEIWKDFQ